MDNSIILQNIIIIQLITTGIKNKDLKYKHISIKKIFKNEKNKLQPIVNLKQQNKNRINYQKTFWYGKGPFRGNFKVLGSRLHTFKEPE